MHNFGPIDPSAAGAHSHAHSLDQRHLPNASPAGCRGEWDREPWTVHVPAELRELSKRTHKAAGASPEAGFAGAPSSSWHPAQVPPAAEAYQHGRAATEYQRAARPPSFGGDFELEWEELMPPSPNNSSEFEAHRDVDGQTPPGLEQPAQAGRYPDTGPPGLPQPAGARTPSTEELSLLLKSLKSVGEVPAFDLGGPEGRGERLQKWRVELEMQLRSARPLVAEWWSWVWSAAEDSYHRWSTLPPLERHRLRITVEQPLEHQVVENWFYPRVLGAMPVHLRDGVYQDEVHGMRFSTSEVILRLLQSVHPNSQTEQDQVLRHLTSPTP